MMLTRSLLLPKDPPPRTATTLTRLNTILILVFLKVLINSERWIPSIESILSPTIYGNRLNPLTHLNLSTCCLIQ